MTAVRSPARVVGSNRATARAHTTEEIAKSLAENAKVLGAIDEDDEDEDAAMFNEAFGVKTGKSLARASVGAGDRSRSGGRTDRDDPVAETR